MFNAARTASMLQTCRRQAFTCRRSSRIGFQTGRKLSSVPNVTEVEKIILDTIKTTGPVPFSTYMQLCLSHPTHGYYMNPSHPIFGTRGDFITSPEISQVFGELVGIWLLNQWVAAGHPSSIRIVELGPGTGTLMSDILRIVSKLPVAKSLQEKSVILVENSPSLRNLQMGRLSQFAEQHKWDLHWSESIEEISSDADVYTILVAHEFFDALPIHMLEKTSKGWQELLVSSTDDASAPSKLRAVLSPEPSPVSRLLGLSSPRFGSLPIGSRLEVSPTSFKISRKIGELIAESSSGGSALIIDYGGDKSFGNSFRAFKDHQIVDIFHRPGECDLTANVDFAYLKEAFSDIALPHGPVSQADFLERMGVHVRANALLDAATSEERREDIFSSVLRLMDPVGMGKEYQVMGITKNKTGVSEGEVWPFVNPCRDAQSGS